MNTIGHFLTGYLFARLMKDPKSHKGSQANSSYSKRYRYDSFECFFAGFAAYSIDLDSFINNFTPMEHGVFSHTIVGAMLFALFSSLLVYPFVRKFPENSTIPFSRLMALSTVGVFSHLLFDLIPYLPDDPVARANEIDHHMYFWPLWDFPVHFNTIFPGYTYTIRVIVEVVYMVQLGAFLIYDWLKNNRLFAKSLYPPYWHQSSNPKWSSWGAFYLLYGLMTMSIFFVSNWWIAVLFVGLPLALLGIDQLTYKMTKN